MIYGNKEFNGFYRDKTTHIFFHSSANGRKRKTQNIMAGRGRLETRQEIQKHIYDFYKNLFGSEKGGNITLAVDIWQVQGCAKDYDKGKFPVCHSELPRSRICH